MISNTTDLTNKCKYLYPLLATQTNMQTVPSKKYVYKY